MVLHTLFNVHAVNNFEVPPSRDEVLPTNSPKLPTTTHQPTHISGIDLRFHVGARVRRDVEGRHGALEEQIRLGASVHRRGVVQDLLQELVGLHPLVPPARNRGRRPQPQLDAPRLLLLLGLPPRQGPPPGLGHPRRRPFAVGLRLNGGLWRGDWWRLEFRWRPSMKFVKSSSCSKIRKYVCIGTGIYLV